MKIIITGKINSGKSTVLNKALEKLKSFDISGYFTFPVLENNERAGFYIESFNGKKEIFAHINFHIDYRFKQYGVKLKVFEDLCVPILKDSLRSDILVIDELGIMETESEKFIRKLVLAVKKHHRLIFVIQERALDFWLKQLGAENFTETVYVAHENRDGLPELIYNKIVRS